ncbi:MAG: 50S ribosomal protein L10 [Vampirovibrionales bacterium]|nr:50S ribosomal protein L10 [Vampirovibrionales bacterium]
MGALPQKKEAVVVIEESLNKASVAYVFDYRGLTVAEITKLRRKLYKTDAVLIVTKNTLLRRAITGTNKEAMMPFLAGPTAILYGYGDQVAPLKAMKEFLKETKKEKDNVIRGGVLDGAALSPADVDQLAKLPSREVLLAQLVGGIASPSRGLVAAISGPQRSLVNVLDQFAQKQQAAS